MKPRIELCGATLRANVRAYAALGVPVAAVVKNDAYGWGFARVVREIDGEVESYVVADESEFWALRMRTRRPIRLLAPVAPARIAAVCAHGGVPSVTTPGGVAAAAAHAERSSAPVTIRVGVVDAAGWAAVAAADISAFATMCAGRGLRVELWTHVTAPSRRDSALHLLHSCVQQFASAGVEVVDTDVASTAWTQSGTGGGRVRVGAGLFGARLGGTVTATCAIRVVAPLVDWFAPGSVAWAGYGETAVPPDQGVAVLRCGYGDGFPKKLAGYDDILSVGMQYTARLASRVSRNHALIDEVSDLDRLADRAGLIPQELITGLAQRT